MTDTKTQWQFDKYKLQFNIFFKPFKPLSLFLPLLRANFSRVSILSVFLTSSARSLSVPKFLCISHHQPPQFDAPVLPLFVFIPPLSPPLSFHPSIQLLRGRALRFSVYSPFPPLIGCEGESYGAFEQDCGCYMLSFSWVSVCAQDRDQGMHSPRSSLKFLRSAIRYRCTTLTSDRERGTLGRSCDKTPFSLLHVHSFSLKFSLSLLTFSPYWCFVAVWMEMKHCNMKRSFSSWSWTLKSVNSCCFIFFFANHPICRVSFTHWIKFIRGERGRLKIHFYSICSMQLFESYGSMTLKIKSLR